MEENCGLLWQFKDCVVGWTLGVSGYKEYAHLFHKESNSLTSLQLKQGRISIFHKYLMKSILIVANWYQTL